MYVFVNTANIACECAFCLNTESVYSRIGLLRCKTTSYLLCKFRDKLSEQHEI